MTNPSTYSSSRIDLAYLSRIQAKRRIQGIEVFLLSVGIFSSFYINIVGQFYLTEIILVLLFPFLWVRYGSGLLKNPVTRMILLFGSLWFLNQAFTDILRDTPVNDLLRGWAGILVLLVSFSSLYILIRRNIRRIRIFLLGYSIGVIASLYLQPSASFSAEPWKFGFGYPVTLLVLLLVTHTCAEDVKRLKKWVLPLIIFGGLSIYLNARSLGAIVILTAVILWLRSQNFGKTILTRVSPQSILAGGLIIGLAIWGLVSIYGFAAQKGYLGEEARLKYVWQDSGRFGLILGGRSEILASAVAIRDAPVIGHGSWAKNSAYRVLLYRLIDLGYGHTQTQLDQYINQSDLIPAHSHVFQAWVWAGILGALFWLLILGFIVKVFLQSNRFPTSLYVFVVFFSISSVWDIFFSPFASIMRLRWVFQLIVFIAAYYQSQHMEQPAWSPVFNRSKG